MRLIDAHKLWDVMNKATLNHIVTNTLWNTLKSVVENAPTIDAVEVVRCGECKHMIADGRCMEFADDGIRPSAMDYCSYGERREDGEV